MQEELKVGDEPRQSMDIEDVSEKDKLEHLPDAKSESRQKEDDDRQMAGRPKKKKKIAKTHNKRLRGNRKAPTMDNDQVSVSRNQDLDVSIVQERGLTTGRQRCQNGDVQTLEDFHIKIDRTYFSRVTPEDIKKVKQVVEYNQLSSQQLLNVPADKSRVRILQTQQYIQFLKDISKQKDTDISVLVDENGKYFQVSYEPVIDNEQIYLKPLSYVLLNSSQFNLLKIRWNYFDALNKKLNEYNMEREEKTQLDEVSREMLFFNNLLTIESQKIQQQIRKLQAKVEEDSQIEQPSYVQASQIQDKSTEFLIVKNFKNSIRSWFVDTFAYFRCRQGIQQNKIEEPFSNVKELQEYTRKKAFRKNKKSKYPLATACMGCLSDTYKPSNTFKPCNECGSRFHQYCLIMTNSLCTVCQGKKLRKNQQQECCLCPNRGLMYRNIGDANAHVWCLLAFKNIHFKNRNIHVEGVQTKEQEGNCLYCRESKGRLIKCGCRPDCRQVAHPLCSFFAGCSLTIKQNLEWYCNTPSDLAFHQEFTRKYILNYGKLAQKCFCFEDFLKERNPVGDQEEKPEEQAEGADEPFLSE